MSPRARAAFGLDLARGVDVAAELSARREQLEAEANHRASASARAAPHVAERSPIQDTASDSLEKNETGVADE
jgi:hypothetical protein